MDWGLTFNPSMEMTSAPKEPFSILLRVSYGDGAEGEKGRRGSGYMLKVFTKRN